MELKLFQYRKLLRNNSILLSPVAEIMDKLLNGERGKEGGGGGSGNGVAAFCGSTLMVKSLLPRANMFECVRYLLFVNHANHVTTY